jgi:thermitase
MKALKSILPILIIASLLAISQGTAARVLAPSNSVHILEHTASIPINTASGEKWEEENPTTNNAHPLFTRSVTPELLATNDPDIERQWALTRIHLSDLWQITKGSPETLVAVLDTGIDRNHEDLSNKVVAEINLTDSPTPDDIYGHGTHVAGIIAANINNGVGIAGVAPESRLLNVKVADDKGRCSASVVAQAVIWAVNNGASVINISLELREPSPELENAVNYAWNKGAVIIAAAGNDASQLPVYPAYYKNSIAVAATKQDDDLAPLSNYGDWVDVAAPGFNIYSTLPGNSYGYETGTSFAAGYVSGLAALLFSIVTDTNGDNMVNDEVRAAFQATYGEARYSASCSNFSPSPPETSTLK